MAEQVVEKGPVPRCSPPGPGAGSTTSPGSGGWRGGRRNPVPATGLRRRPGSSRWFPRSAVSMSANFGMRSGVMPIASCASRNSSAARPDQQRALAFVQAAPDVVVGGGVVVPGAGRRSWSRTPAPCPCRCRFSRRAGLLSMRGVYPAGHARQSPRLALASARCPPRPPHRRCRLPVETPPVAGAGGSALLLSLAIAHDRLTWLLETVWVMLAFAAHRMEMEVVPLTRLLCWLAAHALVLIHGGAYAMRRRWRGCGCGPAAPRATRGIASATGCRASCRRSSRANWVVVAHAAASRRLVWRTGAGRVPELLGLLRTDRMVGALAFGADADASSPPRAIPGTRSGTCSPACAARSRRCCCSRACTTASSDRRCWRE